MSIGERVTDNGPTPDAPAAARGREHPDHARGGRRGGEPGDAVLDRQGQLGDAAPGAARRSIPRRRRFRCCTSIRPGSSARCTSSATRMAARARACELIVHINQEGVAQGINPFDSRLRGAHRHDEDRGAQAGARQVRVRRGLRRRPARRGEVAGQGAGVLVPLGAAPLGPEEPAPGAVAPVQRAQAQGRVASGCSRCRTGPSSTSGSTSTCEQIPIVPLYFAAQRPVVERDGTLIMVDDDRMPLAPGRAARDAERPLSDAGLLSADRRDRERRRPR